MRLSAKRLLERHAEPGQRGAASGRSAPVAVVPQGTPALAGTVALFLALVMREKPLSEEMIEVVRGKTEVPEY